MEKRHEYRREAVLLPWEEALKVKTACLLGCFIFTSYVVATPTWFSNKRTSLSAPPMYSSLLLQPGSFIPGRFLVKMMMFGIFFIYFSHFPCPWQAIMQKITISYTLPNFNMLIAFQVEINVSIFKMQNHSTTEIILPQIYLWNLNLIKSLITNYRRNWEKGLSSHLKKYAAKSEHEVVCKGK